MGYSDDAAAVLPVRVSRGVPWLVALIVALALVAAGLGFFSRGGDGPFPFATLRGQSVRLDGRGIYRNDTVFVAAGNRGTDAVTLVLGLPLLIGAVASYRRGSLRGAPLLPGALAYFLYAYASLALGTAYIDLFLVYVALFSASLFALALVTASIDRVALLARCSPGVPRRGPAACMFGSGSVTLLVWLGPLVTARIADQPPKPLDSYATMVTHALDLAIIVPLCLVAGGLLLRRAAPGYLIAFPLLGLIVLLGPAIAAQTATQLAAGIAFAPPEVAGPIGGFGIPGMLAIWVMVALLRHVAPVVTPNGRATEAGAPAIAPR